MKNLMKDMKISPEMMNKMNLIKNLNFKLN